MNRALSIGVLGALLLAATPAMASDDARCGNTPRSQWLPEATIISKVTDLGYAITKVKTDDGCYEIKATDKNGAKVELYVDPATGEVVKPTPGTEKKS
jgi:hypothetical protein